MYSKLQYISQGETAKEQEYHISKVLDAGADWIQLRWKKGQEKELLNLALKIKERCAQYQATYIINDHIHLAKAIETDGVHLGLTDYSVGEARHILGPSMLIGGTANTINDVQQRITEKCDYIGLGPLRFTRTKEKLSPVLGFDGLQNIMEDLTRNAIEIPPIYAIGGITFEDVDALQQIGIYGVALSALLTKQPQFIQQFKDRLLCNNYK